MKHHFLLFILHFTLMAPTARAQGWTLQQCMQYAVAHNHEVRQAELQLDNYKASRTGVIGSFLPSMSAGVGAQYNFGRAIDPETNGYTNVSTFNNGYSLSASLPVFDGFSRLHALQAAEASLLMGQSALRQQQDRTALSVLQAYANVAYYQGLVTMASEKVQEMTLLLRQTRLLEEVGRKGAADVAQVASQQAEADYELTRQQNLLASALLELKKEMGYPLQDSLQTDSFTLGYKAQYRRWYSSLPSVILGSTTDGTFIDISQSPELQTARYQVQASEHEWRQARASLFPTLSVSAGLSTSYFKMLHADAGQSFRQQLKNNMGEYVGATVSIPLFSRLQTLTSIRRARNNYRMACEAYEQKQLELDKLSREACQDWQGYVKQTEQMERKVEADRIAYQLTRRQFEEGLSTAIDLRATSVQLLNSKATLLQCQLMAMVKAQLVRYYKGETIWTE